MDKIIEFIQNASTNLWLFFLILVFFLAVISIACHLCLISDQLKKIENNQKIHLIEKCK